MLVRERALVLKSSSYQESNLLITLLSPKYGLLRAVAHKAQAVLSPLHTTCQPFVIADYLMRYSSHGLSTVLQGEMVQNKIARLHDLAVFSYASAISEWITRMGEPDGLTHPSRAFVLCQEVYTLMGDEVDPGLLFLYFQVNTLSEAGLSLNPDDLTRWSVTDGAKKTLERISFQSVLEVVHMDLSAEIVYELLKIIQFWIFDRTGIVLKSLKIALTLADGG